MNDQAPVAYAPLWRTAWRRLRQRPFQYILLVLGIALGVAMIVAIDVSSNSAQRAFDLSARPSPENLLTGWSVAPPGWTNSFMSICADTGTIFPLR